MDWADDLAASVTGPQVVNDSKTPSGTVHVGSLRGPVILDVIARALRYVSSARLAASQARRGMKALRDAAGSGSDDNKTMQYTH